MSQLLSVGQPAAFFYDEAGAQIREANMPKVEEKLQGYTHVTPTA